MSRRARPVQSDSKAFRAGLEDFIEALRVEAGLSRNTLLAYRADIEGFLSWVARRGVRRWRDVRTEQVIDYLGACRDEGQAEASVARRLSAIRMCLRRRAIDRIRMLHSGAIGPQDLLRPHRGTRHERPDFGTTFGPA